MIEESVLENERAGNFHRVFPSADFMSSYKNFFEEERYNDQILHKYIFNHKYKSSPLVVSNDLPYGEKKPKMRKAKTVKSTSMANSSLNQYQAHPLYKDKLDTQPSDSE